MLAKHIDQIWGIWLSHYSWPCALCRIGFKSYVRLAGMLLCFNGYSNDTYVHRYIHRHLTRELPRAAVTKYQKLGVLKQQSVLSPSSEGSASKAKEWIEPHSLWNSVVWGQCLAFLRLQTHLSSPPFLEHSSGVCLHIIPSCEDTIHIDWGPPYSAWLPHN